MRRQGERKTGNTLKMCKKSIQHIVRQGKGFVKEYLKKMRNNLKFI